MLTHLCSGYTIHEAGLLESFFTHCHGNLPSVIDNFMNNLDRSSGLVHLVFHIKVNIVSEIPNLKNTIIFNKL